MHDPRAQLLIILSSLAGRGSFTNRSASFALNYGPLSETARAELATLGVCLDSLLDGVSESTIHEVVTQWCAAQRDHFEDMPTVVSHPRFDSSRMAAAG